MVMPIGGRPDKYSRIRINFAHSFFPSIFSGPAWRGKSPLAAEPIAPEP
jgi:hypothetical protein